MDFRILGEQDFFHLTHEFQTQVAVVQDDPLASHETSPNHF
jgi:hypothetical protein